MTVRFLLAFVGTALLSACGQTADKAPEKATLVAPAKNESSLVVLSCKINPISSAARPNVGTLYVDVKAHTVNDQPAEVSYSEIKYTSNGTSVRIMRHTGHIAVSNSEKLVGTGECEVVKERKF